MLRALMTRRWLGVLGLAVVFCVAAIALGNWQYSRHEAKAARIDRIEAHYGADPVGLGTVLERPDEPLAPGEQWTRVSVRGVYAAGDQQFIRNRPNHSVYGYEVVVPLELPGGGALLVDRGWVPNAETASTLPDVPPVPEGQVEVTGWLRAGEESQGRNLPAGQLATINLPEARTATGQDLYGAYLILEHEDDGTGRDLPRPQALEPPDLDQGPHFAYALQWWLTSPLGFVLLFVMLRREVQDARPVTTGQRTPVPARAKKVRIWDEEDW